MKSRPQIFKLNHLLGPCKKRLRNIAYPLSSSALNITAMGLDTYMYLKLLLDIYSLKNIKMTAPQIAQFINCIVPIRVHLYVGGYTKRIWTCIKDPNQLHTRHMLPTFSHIITNLLYFFLPFLVVTSLGMCRPDALYLCTKHDVVND